MENKQSQKVLFDLICKIIYIFSGVGISYILMNAIIEKGFNPTRITGIIGTLILLGCIFIIRKTQLKINVKLFISQFVLEIFILIIVFVLLLEKVVFGWPLLFIPILISILIENKMYFFGLNVFQLGSLITLVLMRPAYFPQEMYSSIIATFLLVFLTILFIRKSYIGIMHKSIEALALAEESKNNNALLLKNINQESEHILRQLEFVDSETSTLDMESREMESKVLMVNEGIHTQGDAIKNSEAIIQSLAKIIDIMDESVDAFNKSFQKTIHSNKDNILNLDALEALVKENQQSNKTLKERMALLESKINAIQGIVETIHGFSEQTNLLALNASIEAARAGEKGKGFAVVADEIRKLSEETTVSAKAIEQVIAEVATHIEKSVTSVEEINHLADKTVEKSSVASKRSHGLVNIFDKNQGMISEVINEINQANDLRDQVLEIMNKLFQESQVFEKQSKEVVNLIEKQREAIEMVSKKTQAIKNANAALLDGARKEN
jgi:methyl-accepting chemotaxis protein